MNTTTIRITNLGHVRILSQNFDRAVAFAKRMGLIVDTIYGNPAKHLTVDIGCRRAGPMGNHEPRWTDEQRALFVSAGF
ncbi:hypothetical protein AQ913_22330 [Burkholderia pseudomallei]|uniref:hypothetical protein n=1 Tax=Burkholderia pseudomallei TaxID=28450 RepID=UPI0009762780|nr:hypothetical protein [Burkholderia pseudomallei]ONC17958.1 hypothetical protein AQ913_22330 [Burkholderia pseudomallei]